MSKKKIGIEAENEIESINDIFGGQETYSAKENKRGRKKKNIKPAIISAVAAAIIVVAAFGMGDSGKLLGAHVFERLHMYNMASKVINKSTANEFEKEYYGYLSLAESLIEETDEETFVNTVQKLASLYAQIDESKIGRERYRKCGEIKSEAEKLLNYDFDRMSSWLEIPEDVEEQIFVFKSGEYFSRSEVVSKTEKWQKDYEQANRMYGEIMGKDLPDYSSVMMAVDLMYKKVVSGEYGDKDDICFTSYNSKYKSTYDSADAETLIKNMRLQADYNCAKALGQILYNREDVAAAPDFVQYSEKNSSDKGVYENDSGVYKEYTAIPDFGCYLGKAPYSETAADFCYEYSSGDNIREVIKKYTGVLKENGFNLADTQSNDGADIQIYKGGGYTVSLVSYSSDKLFEIHIKTE